VGAGLCEDTGADKGGRSFGDPVDADGKDGSKIPDATLSPERLASSIARFFPEGCTTRKRTMGLQPPSPPSMVKLLLGEGACQEAFL